MIVNTWVKTSLTEMVVKSYDLFYVIWWSSVLFSCRQYSFVLHSRIILCHVYSIHFLYPSICWQTPRLIPELGNCEYCHNQHGCTDVSMYVDYIWYMPRHGIALLYGGYISVWGRLDTLILISITFTELHSVPPCISFPFSPHARKHLLFDDNHSNWGKMGSRCGFYILYLYFSDD